MGLVKQSASPVSLSAREAPRHRAGMRRARTTRATPPGTGDASPPGRPILWRALVAQGRRNARKGVGRLSGGLRYVLIPWETRPPRRGPMAEARGGRSPLRSVSPPRALGGRGGRGCCDALRCSGPHARYTDRASESSLGRKAWVILLNSVVLGIEHCNYCSSTRNS